MRILISSPRPVIVFLLLFITGCDEYSKASFEKLKMDAEKGNASAQIKLGVYYSKETYYGGVKDEPIEAFRWFLKAAEQGDPDGQLKVGSSYLDGYGVPKNEVEAIKWCRKAAEQDYTVAQCVLGSIYRREGVTKNEVEALKWYRKAAEQGSTWGQWTLGGCYLDGIGVNQDPVEAYAYFSLAGETDTDGEILRDSLEKKLTPAQIEAGKKRFKELKKQIEAKIAAKGDKK